MKLTKQQEEQLLIRFDKALWKIVYDFKRKTNEKFYNADDLHSECVIVFIKYIRSCSSMSDIERVPVRDMVNAMCRALLDEQILSYPKRTTNFSKVIKNLPRRKNVDDLCESVQMTTDPWDEVIENLAFQSFRDQLQGREKQIINLRMEGLNNREIAAMLGTNAPMITRTLQRLSKTYKAQSS